MSAPVATLPAEPAPADPAPADPSAKLLGSHLAIFVDYITLLLLSREKLPRKLQKTLTTQIAAIEARLPRIRTSGFTLALKDCDTMVMLAPIKASERSELNDLTPEQRGQFVAQLQPALCTAHDKATTWYRENGVKLTPMFHKKRQTLCMSARSDSAFGFRTVKRSAPPSTLDEGSSSEEEGADGAD
jgi:hypothetical protein